MYTFIDVYLSPRRNIPPGGPAATAALIRKGLSTGTGNDPGRVNTMNLCATTSFTVIKTSLKLHITLLCQFRGAHRYPPAAVIGGMNISIAPVKKPTDKKRHTIYSI
jgi:hypothetical protein